MMSGESSARRLVRQLAGWLASLVSFWAVALIVTGGFDTSFFGLRLTTHDPYRPLMVAALFTSVFMFAGGDDRVVSWSRRGWRALGLIYPAVRRGLELAERWHMAHVLAIAMASAVAVVGITCGAKVGGGADSYGYISEAELFLDGRVTDPQPWAKDVPWPNALSTFAPLGYRPSPDHWLITPPVPHQPRDPWTISPTYAPGLPLLMAAFKSIGGQPGVFWVAPVSGALLVFATFAIGRRLGSPLAGFLGAWLVATSPNVLEMSLGPMSDVPVAAAWACAFWALLGTTMLSGVGAALAGSIAIVIRPNLFFMAVPVFVLSAQQVWTSHREARQRRVWRGLVVMIGLALGMAIAASLNWAMHGSPFMSGYGTLRDVLDVSNVSPNFGNYTRWFSEAQTPLAFAGIAALVLPLRWIWPGVPARSTILCLAAFVAGVWIEYFFWGVFETALYLRFLLSTWPFIMIGLVSVLLVPVRLVSVPLGRAIANTVAIALVGMLGLRGFFQAQSAGVFTQRLGESKYVTAALAARDATPQTSVIFAMQHGGSLRYYAGRMTIRYDTMPSEWMNRALDFLESQGVHPYLLIDEWERAQVVGHFAGVEGFEALTKRPPVMKYREVSLYDLAPDPDSMIQTVALPDDAANLSVVPPAPRPVLAIRK